MEYVQEIAATEDWDNYEGLDVEDEEPLLDVSSDIMCDLESVLCGELRFNGSFAHLIAYPDAINPCLHLDGLGHIGLPLNEREAREMIGQSAFIRNSEGKDVIWSFPGDKVRFDNPGWEAWIKDTVGPAMNAALDAKVPLSAVQYQLKSLTLRGPHTNSIDCFEEIHNDSKQYGTLSIFLPSHHVGGQVHITHEGITKTFDTATHSAASATAIAAYTTVSQRLDPIHSGYVAWLSYQLTFLGRTESIPHLPNHERVMTQLHQVFRSWRQGRAEDEEFGEDETPECVACLFEHIYDDGTANFKATALRGSDRFMLKHVAPLAKTYGFNLHLAHVTYKERGHATVNSVRKRRGGCPCGGCSEDMISSCDEDPADWSDVDVNKLQMDDGMALDMETEVDLSILALDGMPMQMSGGTVEEIKAYDEENSPGCFINGRLRDGPKKASFERERRTWGYLTYAYKRNALIITPEDSSTVDFAIGDVREFACMALKSSLSETPTAKEQRLVEALLVWLPKNRTATTTKDGLSSMTTVANVLRESAVRWGRADLFLQTLDGCGLDQCIKVVGIKGLISGYQAFDWDLLRPVYSEILSKTTSITLRAQLVDGLLSIATEKSASDVLSWCETQNELALDTFQKLEVTEIGWIMKVVQSKLAPTDYLRTILIPRLHSIQPYNIRVWAALLTFVEKCPSESPSWTAAEHPEIIRACLGRVASEIPPYRTIKTKPASRYSQPTLVPTVDPIFSILQLGTRFNCFEVCLPILDNMWLQREKQKTDDSQRPPSVYYMALVPKVENMLQAKPELKEFLGSFFSQAASIFLSSESTLTEVLRTALLRAGNVIETLEAFLTGDRVKELASQGVLLKQLSSFISENLRSQLGDSSEALTTLLKLCLTGMIGSFNQSSLTSQSSYYLSRTNAGIELLTHCFTLRLSSDVDQVLARFLEVPKSNEPGYIRDGLLPLLKALPEFLSKQQLSLLDAPFSTFAGEVAKKFVRHTIGTRPAHVVSLRELQAVGCPCEHCRTSLVPFLTNDQPKVDIRVSVATQAHLEQQLMLAKKWGFTWAAIKQGRLQIVKPQRMIEVGRWAGAQARGYAFLALLGDEQQQRQILGSDYAWVTGTIAGTATPPAVSLNDAKRPPSDESSGGHLKKPRLS